MANKGKETLVNMYSLSETRPKVREEIISRDQLLDHFDDQFEEHKILCVSGEEGVGVTTTLALFAQRHGDECASYFNNGWSRHLLNPQTIMSSLLQQLSHYAGVKLEQEEDKKNLTPIIFKLSKRTKKNNLYFVFDGFAKIPNEYVDSIKAVLAPLFNIENARFLFSGEKEDIVQLLPEALNVKRVNEVLKFQQNDVEGYLKKVVPQLDEEAIDIIYKLSHKGEARRLAILMEKLEKEGIEKIRSYYMNEVDDFYEEDYKWIEDQHDEHITLLMTLFAYSEIPLDKVSVMQTLKQTKEETDELIERCSDYIEEEDGLVGLRSDDYRKYLRVKLADFKTSVELMLIEMIEKSADVDNKFLYLPALYKHVKDKESLVNYLTSDNVQRYLEEKKSQAALNEQCEYGYNACTNFDTQAAAYFRFAINRSVSREIEKNELTDSEIEALIAIGDDEKAFELTQNVFLLEERLKCLLIIAQEGKHLSEAMNEEIDLLIGVLTDSIQFEHIPDKALELAKLMLPIKMGKALEIIDKVAKVTKDRQRIDRLYTAMSLSYNAEGQTMNGNDAKADIISTRILDDDLRKIATVMKSIMKDSTSQQVVAKMKELPTASSQLYFLRYWIPDHRERADIGDAVEYAVKLVIDTSTISMPKVSFLRHFCKPLPDMSKEQVKNVVDMLDAVVANIKYPTVEYVQLMTLVISAVTKHDKTEAKDRLQNLYLEITELKDKALQAHCKALVLRDYEQLGEKKDLEDWIMPAFELQKEITNDIIEILGNSAYHLKVVEGPIKALVCTAPSFLKDVISKMNTRERRNKAYLIAATEYVRKTEIKKFDWAYFIRLLNEVTYDKIELDKPIVTLVDKITETTDKDPKLLEEVKKNYDLFKNVEQAEGLCYIYSYLYVWLSQNYEDADFQQQVKGDLEKAWGSINVPWLKVNTGYFIAKVLSKISMKNEAREYVAKSAELRRTQMLSSYSCVAAYTNSLDLYAHSLGILIRSGMCTDEDLDKFKTLLDYNDAEGESIIMWARVALEYHGAGNIDKFNKIVNSYVSKPLDKFSKFYQKRVLYHIAPALFLSSKPMLLKRMEAYDTYFRNLCFENIARYILTKYPYPEYTDTNHVEAKISLERKDYDNLMDLMEETQDEGFIFSYTNILTRSIKRDMGFTLSRELKNVLYDRLEGIIKKRLPMKNGIQHKGYKIACQAMMDGTRSGGIENGSGLKDQIESVHNKADQAFLYAHVANYLKKTSEKAAFIDKAVEKTEEIDYTFDRFNRYALCLEDAFAAAKSRTKRIAQRAMDSLKSDKNGDYSDYQKMIDLVRDYDEEMAETMLEMVDDDPVRVQYKRLLKKRSLSDKKLKEAKNNVQQVARLNNEEQMRFFEKEMEYLIKRKFVVKDINATQSIIAKIYENPITDTRNAVLFFMENLYQKNLVNKRYGKLLREMHTAILYNLQIVLAIASGTKEKLERVNRIMKERSDENGNMIQVGQGEKGLKTILDWYQENPVDILRIIDPHFHSDDLYIIKALMDINNSLRCQILTKKDVTKYKDETLNEVFQNGWNTISSDLPGKIEVKSCCYEDDPKDCPIHDRWWLLYDTEKEEYRGISMSSPSTLNHKITEITPMTEDSIRSVRKLWERFFNNMVPKCEERKLKYEETLLR